MDVKRAKAKPGKIFVGGLVPELEDEQIKIYFAQFGTVTDCEMPFDKTKNQRKNFCFGVFSSLKKYVTVLYSNEANICMVYLIPNIVIQNSYLVGYFEEDRD